MKFIRSKKQEAFPLNTGKASCFLLFQLYFFNFTAHY